MDFLWILILAGVVVWFMAAREKRKAEAPTEPQPRQWPQTQTTDPETGELVTKFQAPNPATADIGDVRDFVDHELFRPKLEHYLKIAREMNAPVEVIQVIEDRVLFFDERDRRAVEREMEELDRRIEREVRQELRRK